MMVGCDWNSISVFAGEIRDLEEKDILSKETLNEIIIINKNKIIAHLACIK